MTTGVVAVLLLMSLSAMAQCAMCKTAVTGSPEAAKLSQSLNFAVLILLIPPVLIFCGIFVLAYRHRKARGTELDSPSPDDKERRNWFMKSGARRKHKGGKNREAGGAPA
jgi:heme/copper-type cytochrome/quinol oxidase subunit 2